MANGRDKEEKLLREILLKLEEVSSSLGTSSILGTDVDGNITNVGSTNKLFYEDIANNTVYFEDFLNINNTWQTFVTSGAYITSQTPTGDEKGKLRVVTGTTVGSGLSFRNISGSNSMNLGSYAVTAIWKIDSRTLATATEDFVWFLGFTVTTSLADGSESVGFKYNRAVDGNYLTCISTTSSVTTKTVSTKLLVANTKYLLRMDVNSTGTEINYYVCNVGSSIWELLATHTTNIPTGIGKSMFTGGYIIKNAGTVANDVSMDFYYEKYTGINRIPNL